MIPWWLIHQVGSRGTLVMNMPGNLDFMVYLALARFLWMSILVCFPVGNMLESWSHIRITQQILDKKISRLVQRGLPISDLYPCSMKKKLGKRDVKNVNNNDNKNDDKKNDNINLVTKLLAKR